MTKKQKNTITYEITHRCIACKTCVEFCPNDAIKKTYPLYSIDEDLCDSCGLCYQLCRHGAIREKNLDKNHKLY